MLFYLWIAALLLALLLLLLFSFLPYRPRVPIRVRRLLSAALSVVILAGIATLGVRLSQKEAEVGRLQSCEQLASWLMMGYLDLVKPVAFLPEDIGGEIEVSTLQNTAVVMRQYAEAAENIHFYSDGWHPGEGYESGRLYQLLENSSNALCFMTEDSGIKRTIALPSSEREVVSAMREICFSLKEKMTASVYDAQKGEPLSGIAIGLAEYQAYEELLEHDPEIQELYRVIDDYVYERRRNQ